MGDLRGSATPVGSLANFVTGVEHLLSGIINGDLLTEFSESDRPLAIAPEMHGLLREALAELAESNAFSDLREAINDLNDDQLRAHGLSGAQLEAKLTLAQRAMNKVRRIRGYLSFRELIAAVDTLLESILSATGVGTAISELKDVAAGSVEESA